MSHSQYALLDDVWLSMVRMRALCSGGKRVLQASWQAVLCEPSDAYASARKQKALTSALGFADDD